MAQIKFKATRRKHDSGYRLIDKSGDLQFDNDARANDGIWLFSKGSGRIFIDCDHKNGTFRIVFNGDTFTEQK